MSATTSVDIGMQVNATPDERRLVELARLGRLLDEAVDLADRCDESLLSAQIAQAVYHLDDRVAGLRPAPPARDRRTIGTDGID